jgi:RNA polymerase sigma-70 factor, ECF subfamily
MQAPAGEVTRLLNAWATGDRTVENQLFEMVLPDMRVVAQHLMRRERPDHSLQPTALLNEAFLRLFAAKDRDWQNRRHFYAVAARAMRHLLIDHARGRPKGAKIPIEGLEAFLEGRDAQLDEAVAVDALLNQIAETHPQWCSIVELKFFLGFTDEEIADALGIPLRTIQRQYVDARRWLYDRLSKSC